MSELIGLCGLKGSGKTTAAKGLVHNTRSNWTRLAFADPVRELASEWTGVPVEEFENPDLKERVPVKHGFERLTRREILQKIGMFFRSLDENWWVKCASLMYENTPDRVVFDDVRFRNEAGWIRSEDGIVVGIKRPGNHHDDEHPSENRMREHWEEMVDAVIWNDGDTWELIKKLRRTL